MSRSLFDDKASEQNSIIIGILVVFLFLGMTKAIVAEEGCPANQLRDPNGVCTNVSKTSALPLNESSPMRFEAIQESMSRIFIQATGKITESTPEDFRKFLLTDDGKMSKSIYMHSLGGNLMAGLQLGELFRNNRFNTYIGRSAVLEGLMNNYSYDHSICASACAYAFLGGVTRSYEKNATYGVHRFGSSETALSSDDAQVVSGIVASYIQKMGIDQRLMQAAATAAFKDGIFAVSEELGRQLKIITDVEDSIISIESFEERAIARLKFSNKDQEYKGAIFCADGLPIFLVTDLGGNFPSSFATIKNFPATFLDGRGRKLNATASYHKPGNLPVLKFLLPMLKNDSFSGNGLRLEFIDNPSALQDRRNNSRATETLTRLMLWADDVERVAFSIQSSNAAKSLPIVLRECRR